MKPRSVVTLRDRKSHAVASWDRAYQDALNGKLDKGRLVDCMTVLNIVDYMINRERSSEADKLLKHENVDWESAINKSSQNQMDILNKILEEIRTQ